MKSFIIVLSVTCAVVAGYFGARRLTRRDLGYRPARKYVRGLAMNLLHTEITAAREAGVVPEMTADQAA